MSILWLGFTQHESSTVLEIDGEVGSAIARERFSHINIDGSAWGAARLDLKIAIDHCLSTNKLE
jgi:hypothetical protein